MLIVTGSDDNYSAGVMVLIASAAFHNPNARFAVLDMGITPENRIRIDALARRLNISIKRIEVKSDAFDHISVSRSHLTRSTYLRLLIPKLLPDENRVIYMDCDMVVMDDLTLLENLELGNAIIAAVPCPSPDPQEVAATGHIVGTYINAGLLVMNLPVWRRENISGECVALLSDRENPLMSEDQSAINIVAKGRTLYVDKRYNTYSDPGAYKRISDFPENTAVVHYVVNNKPWVLPTSMGSIWNFHAARIEELMPQSKVVSWRRRMSKFNRNRKLYFGLIIGKPKYRMQNRMRCHMNNVVATKYLTRASARARTLI